MSETQSSTIAGHANAGEQSFKRHYSVKGAAIRLSMSERRVRKALKEGDLRFVMFAGRPVIPGSEVRRLAEEIA